MAVTCPECGSEELGLVEVLEDERRRLKCEVCGHEWLRGDAKATPSAARPKRDPAEAKEPTVFAEDDEGYIAWVRTWVGGYVLNCGRTPSPNYLILHRAHCDTITDAGPQATTWTVHEYMKVCSTDRQRIREWAKARTGSDPTPCQLCM
jgi:hypothetical protein